MNNVLLFPGGFKPFHDGHLSILESHIYNLDNIPINEVKIYISNKGRDFIPDAELTYDFLDSIKNNLEDEYNVKFSIEICDNVTPIRKCYITAGNIEEDMCHNVYGLVSSNKDNDIIRKRDFADAYSKNGKYYNESIGERTIFINTNVEPSLYLLRNDDLIDTPISSTIVRKDIKNNDFYNFSCDYTYMLYKRFIIRDELKMYFDILRKLYKND